MKITTLIENTKLREDLEKEHGLSLLIETNGRKILFDSGQSGKIVENAEKLGIDLNEVDLMILSHGHYDHGGGIKAFLKKNDHAEILANKNVFGRYYHDERYIGLDPVLKTEERIRLIDADYQIDDHLRIITLNDQTLKEAINPGRLTKRVDTIIEPDDFRHEHYLLIEEDGKRILFSGCSHKGIINITEAIRPDILIGGFHLMDISVEGEGLKKLEQVGRDLLAYNTAYYTCHCTGRAQYPVLKSILGEHLHRLSTGKITEI